MTEVAYYLSDNVLEVSGLADGISGAYLNSKIVTAQIKDMAGTLVGSVNAPLTLAYVASSDGIYRATVPWDAAFTKNARYVAEISIDAGTGLKAWRATPFKVVEGE